MSPDVYLFLTTGFEETEALTTVDILRRADIPVKTVSLTGEEIVTGRSGISVKADMLYNHEQLQSAEMLVLPGGAVVEGYKNHPYLTELILNHAKAEKPIAAICAAPTYLAELGLLKDTVALCYPAMESILVENGAIYGRNTVEVSGNFITSKGPATTPFFACAIVDQLCAPDMAEHVRLEFLINIV